MTRMCTAIRVRPEEGAGSPQPQPAPTAPQRARRGGLHSFSADGEAMDVAGVVAPDACLLSELLAARRARLAAGRAFRLENVGPALGAFLELVQADDLFDLAPRADGGLSRRAAA